MENENKRAATDQELKDLIKAVADTEKLVSEITTGLSFQELGDLVTVANDLPAVVRESGVFLPEWSSLDDANRADLIAYVQANCKFPSNVTVEAWTQKVLNALVVLSQVYQVFAPPPVTK